MSTINKKEIEKFSKMADEWWDTEGKFKPLHKFNPLRINYIKKKIISHFNIKSKFIILLKHLLQSHFGSVIIFIPLKMSSFSTYSGSRR